MPVSNCAACGRDVSDTLKACPHCGEPRGGAAAPDGPAQLAPEPAPTGATSAPAAGPATVVVVRDHNSGCLSKIIGALLIIFGFLCCLSLIGAIIGIPMIVVGVVIFFAGRWVWLALLALAAYVVVTQIVKHQPPAAPAAPSVVQVMSAPEPAAVATASPEPSLPTGDTYATSFDCAKAAGADERLICASAGLAAEDRSQAWLYRRLMMISEPGDRDALRTTQRAWLATRRDCADEACVAARYEAREPALREAFAARNRILSAALARPGDCEETRIDEVGYRLDDAPGSGSSVLFADGISLTGYDTVPAIAQSRVGDRVRVCLSSIPTQCPPGDDRGRIYGVVNRRTGGQWERADSQHSCGGA